MRIGYFTSIEGWGGSETFLRDLMLGVQAAGHEVVLIGIKGSRLFDELGPLGVECIAWKQGAGQGSNLPPLQPLSGRPHMIKHLWLSVPVSVRLTIGNLRESWRLAKLLRKMRLDVLHVNVHGYEIAGLAGRLASIPSIGCYLIVPPSEASLVRRLFRLITRWTYNHLVFQSEIGRESVMKKSNNDEGTCSIIPNGIEVSERVAAPMSGGGGRRLVSMARLHAMKGHADVIRAMALLKDRDVTLDILGDGPEESALQALIRELGVEDRVRLLGHLEEYQDILCASDGFVMASVSHESCPASLLLAMAATLPVITSDLPALTEINEDGVTGYVARMGDSASIAAAIRRLIDQPQDAIQRGLVGRERVIRLFSRQRMIEAWDEVYDGVISRRLLGAPNS